MSDHIDAYSNARLVDAGKRAGYSYLASCASGDAATKEPMFSGRLVYESFSSGVTTCFSDMISLVESEHAGVLNRSWTVAINLGEQETALTLGDRKQLSLPPDDARVVAICDQTPMTNRVMPKLRCRSLVVSLAPGVITDGELAEAIETATSGTQLERAFMTPRLRHLADCLSRPTSPGAAGRLLAESRALELVAHLLEHTDGNPKTRFGELSTRDLLAVERVRDAIHAAPHRDFTLQQLATDAGMSLSSLKSKFPKAFGQTVFTYLRAVRLDYARDRIVQDGWTVSEAAHFVGYGHVGNFSKAFRSRFSVSPLEARRR